MPDGRGDMVARPTDIMVIHIGTDIITAIGTAIGMAITTAYTEADIIIQITITVMTKTVTITVTVILAELQERTIILLPIQQIII